MSLPMRFPGFGGRALARVEPRQIEVIPPKRPRSEYRGDAKTLPRAIDVYPNHRDHIARLKNVGVSVVYGIFSERAWSETAKAARVHRMPVDGRALGDVSELVREIEAHIRANRWLLNDGPPNRREIANSTAAVIRKRERDGTLLPLLFPTFTESKHDRAETVTLALPQPPDDILETSMRVRLAGYDIRIGAPAEAIKVLGIEDMARRIADQAIANWKASKKALVAIDPDPILFAEMDGVIIVLDMWGEPPTPECEALYRVLRSMAVQL